MDADRWQRLSPHLDALLELPAPARARRLEQLAGDDAALAAELARMLALDAARDDFLAHPLVVPRALREGSEVGPYRLEALLGEGGMGQVWRASRADGLYQRRVALKLLRPGLADRNLRLRFARERQILARLAHPHIAGLLDAGISAEGVPYLALEYVEGEPITRYWQRLDVPLHARLRMFRQVCEAVSHAHANLVVHCDLKPSNILVTANGQVRLLDFGIAKLLDGAAPRPDPTRTGARAFTLHYAAPEQIRGGPVTTMTDVYSLGVVLYELLTGLKPYPLRRQSDAEWEEAILVRDPLRPSQALLRQSELRADRARRQALRRRAKRLMGDLDNIVLRTLSKRPDGRYPSAEALSRDIQRHLDGEPVQARPQSLAYRARKYVRRHRWTLAGAGTLALVLSTAVGIVFWQSGQALEEARRAQAMRAFIVGLFEQAGDTPDGRALDLRALLDGAVGRVDRDLAREPRARAEVLGVIARLRAGLGDYREARALLDRQAALLATAAQAPDGLRLEAAAQRGDVLRRLGEAGGCADAIRPVLPLAGRVRAQLPAEVAEVYSQLGRCERALGNAETARRLFTRALALRGGLHVPGAAVAEIESRLDLAALQADAGQAEAALAGYRGARRRLDAAVGPRHPLQVEIGRQVAAVQQRLGHHGRAEQALVSALAVAEALHGPQHPATLAVRGELADVLVAQARYRDAAVPLRMRHAMLASRLGATHPELRESWLGLGEVEWQLDHLPAALDALQAAVGISRRSGRPDDLAQDLATLARTLHEAGRDGDARPLLLEARDIATARHGAADARVAAIDHVLGDVDASLGLPGALPRLQRAAQVLQAAHGPDDPRARAAVLSLARRQAAAGDPAGRRALAALAATAAGDQRPAPLAWRAAGQLDALRCTGDGRDGAIRHLARLVEAVRRAHPDGSATGRELVRLLRGCERPRREFLVTGTP